MKTFFILLVLPLWAMANDIHVIGKFEKFNFEFRVKNINELKTECINFTSAQRIAHIDDIYVSFNSHKRLHLHNQDGMWHYPKHICAELEKIAQSIDLTPPAPNEYRELELALRFHRYTFTGSNEAEIFNDCIEQLEEQNFKETDYIRFRLSAGTWSEMRNHHGWWRSAQQLCTIIDQAVFKP